jgi:hypothetical protein
MMVAVAAAIAAAAAAALVCLYSWPLDNVHVRVLNCVPYEH